MLLLKLFSAFMLTSLSLGYECAPGAGHTKKLMAMMYWDIRMEEIVKGTVVFREMPDETVRIKGSIKAKMLVFNLLSVIVILPISLGYECQSGAGHTKESMAIMYWDKRSKEHIKGRITFSERPDGTVRIKGGIHGMVDGIHAIHIHKLGVGKPGSPRDCYASGPHFNPSNTTHGGPFSQGKHVGDLGNANTIHGNAFLDFIHTQVRLTPGSENREIICRTIDVHRFADDNGQGGVDSQGKVVDADAFAGSMRSGNAGPRIACGTVFPVCNGEMVLSACDAGPPTS